MKPKQIFLKLSLLLIILSVAGVCLAAEVIIDDGLNGKILYQSDAISSTVLSMKNLEAGEEVQQVNALFNGEIIPENKFNAGILSESSTQDTVLYNTGIFSSFFTKEGVNTVEYIITTNLRTLAFSSRFEIDSQAPRINIISEGDE